VIQSQASSHDHYGNRSSTLKLTHGKCMERRDMSGKAEFKPG